MTVGFVRKPVQKPRKLQPDCPVRLYSYVCSVETRSRAHCVQLRFVNCADSQVDSLFLRIRGLGEEGKVCYALENVSVTGCRAEPKSVFGEERLIFLPSVEIAELEIMVEWVLFSDGMMWKRLPEHSFDSPEVLGMVRCACGMWNHGERCSFCARPLTSAAAQSAEPEEYTEPLQSAPAVEEKEMGTFSVPDLGMDEFASMMQETAFVLRSMQEEPEFTEEDEDFSIVEEEDSHTGSRAIWIMLLIIAALALLTVVILEQKGYFG